MNSLNQDSTFVAKINDSGPEKSDFSLKIQGAFCFH